MLIRADARHLPLVDGCVQCVVTSPPYFGLRDYGHAGQIGLEPSPDAYVAELVAVFREVRRVLKDDGVCWVNLGDSYTASSPGQTSTRITDAASKQATNKGSDIGAPHRNGTFGLASKNLLGVPWRVVFALQADGWYLRSDVIWAKPNQMPESVTDRPTKSHEYLFLLAKSERYYYDAAAIAEPVSEAMLTQMDQGYDGLGLKDYEGAGVQNPSSVKARIIANARSKNINGNMSERGVTRTTEGLNLKTAAEKSNVVTRNRRTVWNIATMPYAGAHFATMPEALVEPCILAGSRPGDLVLDPFVGSGTVLAVAGRFGRRGVGTDLSYQDLAKKRTAQRGLRLGA